MKGFKLNSNGDIVISNDIELVSDNKLIKQTLQTVLQTNKGEWWFNKNEGINFNNILIKNPNYEVIKAEISNGIIQVNNSIQLQELKYNLDNKTRKLKINFTAKKQNGMTISCLCSY